MQLISMPENALDAADRVLLPNGSLRGAYCKKMRQQLQLPLLLHLQGQPVHCVTVSIEPQHPARCLLQKQRLSLGINLAAPHKVVIDSNLSWL
jgi:hypothetical protein